MPVQLVPSLESTYSLLKKALQNDVVLVTGPPSTGKTTIVRKAFEEDLEQTYLAAYVDCYATPSQARLFSTICQAFGSRLNLKARAKAKVRLPGSNETVNTADFPRLLDEYQRIAEEKGFEALYVILDHVQIFEKTNLMDSFVALCRAMTHNCTNLRLVVISYEDPSDIVHYITHKSPAIGASFQDRMQVISCCVWSREDIVEWILRLPPRVEELYDLYAKFVRNVVGLVFATSDSKDPRQIRMYCQQNFAEFLVYHREKTKDQIRKLLKVGPDASLDDDILKEYSLGDPHNTALVQSFLNSHRTIGDKRRANFKWTHHDSEVKITLNTATMIVASYIAANTRLAEDKTIFGRGKAKLKSKITDKNSDNKPFTLERLMQIYIQIMRRSVGERELHLIYNNDCSLADVERLENLNILQHQGGYELSSEARYRLSRDIKRSYVERLAQHSSISLDWYL